MSEFKTEKKENLFYIYFPEAWKKETNQTFTNLFSSWIDDSNDIYIFDFSKLVIIDADNIGSLITFSNLLKKNNKKLYTLSASSFIQMKLRNHLTQKHFIFITSMNDIGGTLQENSPAEATAKVTSKRAIDVRIINPFIDAAMNTLSVQCSLKITPQSIYIRSIKDQPNVEIAGVISLICDEFCGSISLCFTNNVFLNIYEAMVGEKHTQVSSEIQDAASELMNIIYGFAKTNLNSQLKTNLKPALPTLLVGEKIRIHQNSDLPIVVVPFESNAGPFHIAICTESSTKKIAS